MAVSVAGNRADSGAQPPLALERQSAREPVGAENLCHLAGCSADRWMLGPASGMCQAGLGLPGRGMIFGLWA
jgi:hypothetical protein